MDIPIIAIGNSKGFRLPKALIEKYNITDTVELTLKEDCIIMKPKLIPRKDWEQAFKMMHKKGDDKPLME